MALFQCLRLRAKIRRGAGCLSVGGERSSESSVSRTSRWAEV